MKRRNHGCRRGRGGEFGRSANYSSYLSERRSQEVPDGLFGNEYAGLLPALRNDIKGYLHMEMLNLWIGTKLDEAGTGFSR